MDLFGNDDMAPGYLLPEGDSYCANWNADRQGHEITVPEGKLFFAGSFFRQKISDRCLAYFQENDKLDWRSQRWRDLTDAELAKVSFDHIAWKQDFIRLYGKSVPLPRLTSWYGDEGASYTYSGIASAPNEWNNGLVHLKQLVEAAAGTDFNSVLMNWYRDGEDHMSWHADDEKSLGINPVIASANFGETRDFVIRRKDDHKQKITLSLGHGSLLIMGGELQHHWEHSVPRRKRVSGSRFNLTFRRIVGLARC